MTLDEVGHYLPALYFAYNTLRRHGVDRLYDGEVVNHGINNQLDEIATSQS